MGVRSFKRIENRLHTSNTLLLTTPDASRRMHNVRRTGTNPELAVRKIASSLGLRYRTINRNLPGSPDLANRSKRWAVFVHGCYWHRHGGCPRTSTPKSNRKFWQAKFQRNVQRDRAAIRALRHLGFDVVVIWECESRDVEELVKRLGRLRH